MKNPILTLEEHKHGDHSHIKLKAGNVFVEKGGIRASDEGCPCCAAGIDLDEIATAISEIGKEGTGDGGAASSDHGGVAGGLADFSSASHWGIFLGVSGPLAVVGLTAAIRNVKGTINTRKKLNHVINGLERDIEKYKIDGNTSVVERLEAFKRCLKYSKFDTDFNLVVPDVINGVASGIVLSSAIWHSPWALPVIGAYAACQTGRNVADLVRTWNRILPENFAMKPLEESGVVKVNKITKSKRMFYSANAFGFLIFTTGAVLLFLSIIGIFPPLGAVFIAGIVLLAFGAVATGVMNNIWTNKFKPRNGNLGIDRKDLNCWRTLEEVGKRRETKKVINKYRKQHIPYSTGDNVKKFAYKMLTSLPFCEQKGASLIHKMNMAKLEHLTNNLEKSALHKQRMLLLKQVVQVTVPNFKFNKDDTKSAKVFRALKELELEGAVLERFIKDFIIQSNSNHDTSVKDLKGYKAKLLESGLFKEVVKECNHHHHNEKHHSKKPHNHSHHNHSHSTINIEFNLDALENNAEAFQVFMNSIEQHTLFEHNEKLRYEQYGLNDYFWQIDKSENQWKPQLDVGNSALQMVNIDGLQSGIARNITQEKQGNCKENARDFHNHKHGLNYACSVC